MMEPHNLMKGMMSNHDQQTRPWGLDISKNIGVGLVVQEFVGSYKMLKFSITSSYFMVSTLSRTLIEFALQCELIEGFAWIKAKKGPKMITLRIPIY
jgi:hypothetical protein